ncbi:MAG: GNAT family N-acetyltransferase [Geminicoccaceae bacterium]
MPNRVIRKLTMADASQFRDHLLRLDPESRISRFSGFIGDTGVITYADRFDWLRAYAVGCFFDGELRGVAELRPCSYGRDRVGEIALSVEAHWQGRGIGRELLDRLVLIARNRGFRILVMLCLPTNQRMRDLAKRHRGRFEADPGQVEACIVIDVADAFSMGQEALSDSLSAYASLLLGHTGKRADTH